MISERTAWRWCALAGIVTLAISMVFGAIGGLVGCGGPDDLGPIMRFELARSPNDVATLLGAEPCRATLLGAMRTATWLDALAFIPAYCGFLILALLALQGSSPKIALAGMAAIALAGALDEIEGVLLFAIMDALPGTQSSIDLLIPLVRAKFGLIGLGVMMIAGLIIRRGGVGLALGGIIAIGGALSLAGLTGDARAGLLILGNTVAWPCLLLAAVIFGFRPFGAPASV